MSTEVGFFQYPLIYLNFIIVFVLQSYLFINIICILFISLHCSGDVRVGSGKREATMTNCDGKLCVHGNVVCTPGMEMHLQGIHEDNSVSQQRFGPGRFPAGGVRERDSSVAVGVSISLSS